MKTGLTKVFSTIFEVLGRVIKSVKTFTLDLVILGLKGYIAIKPVIRAVQEFSEKFHVLHGLLTAGKVVLAVVGIAIGVVVAAFVLVGVAIGAVIAAFGALVSTVSDFVSTAIAALSDWASSGVQMAEDFISGLIGGITAGVGKAVDAVKNLGDSVMGGIKGVLGIHSPSIEMMKLGGHTAGGFAAGIMAGAPVVGGAAQAMAGAANDNAVSATAYQGAAGAAGAKGADGGSATSGGGISVTVEAGAIVIQGGAGSATDLTEEAVSLIFERVALARGA